MPSIAAPGPADTSAPHAQQPIRIYILFFCSGFPALLYQIVWQRALFAIYGVNVQSVTIVVSVFMLGLGLGSLLGGEVSRLRGLPLLAVFGLIEFGIGCYGVCSLPVFHYAARFTAGAQPLQTGLIAFFLLLFPTILMGATLPILAAYIVSLSGNVGRSVGALYCVNTMGSAVACFVAALLTMPYLGESGSVKAAAAINATIGCGALLSHFRSRRGDDSTQPKRDFGFESSPAPPPIAISMRLAIIVSGLSGFIALGYEILWYRGCSYALATRAPAFALLLGFYLFGIAIGSLLSRALCDQITKESQGRFVLLIATFVLFANISAFLLLPAMSFLNRLRYGFGMPPVTIATCLLGATFPLICHAAVPADYRAGQGLSRLYLSNIIGSTLGSFLIGYVLMDYWGAADIDAALGLAGLALVLTLLLSIKIKTRAVFGIAVACGVLSVFILAAKPPLFHRLYERFAHQEGTYRRIIENRSGVIAVDRDNAVYGGGAYDGRFNTSLVKDTNGIFRPYSMAFLHPAPRRVLMIGLSSGSWAQVILNNPGVEHLTVVEINPGYIQLIREHPEVASILGNAKLSIEIDDGRRWLTRNRDAKFDMVVQNTTWAWRAHVSNLLSVEYLKLVRTHLKYGGVFFYNTTVSPNAILTAVSVYPYAVKIWNCVAVSDVPLQLDRQRWERTILQYRIDGALVIDPADAASAGRLSELRSMYDTAEDAEALRREYAGNRWITDDNMGTEWTDFWLYVKELAERRLSAR